MITLQKNVSLKPFNTFGIEVYGYAFVSIDATDTLRKLFADKNLTEYLILGGGSNVLLAQDFKGLVIHINTKGIDVVAETEKTVRVEVQAGENWHAFICWCLEKNYGGVENLALIPGSVGAAPIQNIGAYGVELKNVFYSCKAFKMETLEEEEFFLNDCEFDYRTSIFKTTRKGQYIITSVQLELQKSPHTVHTAYGAITAQLGNKAATIQNIAEAVMAIRSSKLPDPKELGNSGSFFKNPIISKDELENLLQKFPDLPHYPFSKTAVKVSAAWMIDFLKFKGYRKGDAGVHTKQALILVNHGKASGKDILSVADKIQKAVGKEFGIVLEPEVNIVG